MTSISHSPAFAYDYFVSNLVQTKSKKMIITHLLAKQCVDVGMMLCVNATSKLCDFIEYAVVT